MMDDDDLLEIVCVLQKTQINGANEIPSNLEITHFNCSYRSFCSNKKACGLIAWLLAKRRV